MIPAVTGLAQQSRSGGLPLVDDIGAAAEVLRWFHMSRGRMHAAGRWPKFSGLRLALGRLSPPVGAAGPAQHSGGSVPRRVEEFCNTMREGKINELNM